MTVNWNESNEFDNGLIIDEVIYLGDDNGEGQLRDGYVPKLFMKELPFTFFNIPIDREIKIPEGHQLYNVDGLEVNGQLTIEGSLVI